MSSASLKMSASGFLRRTKQEEINVQAMPLFHLGPVQFEMLRRPSAGVVIPAVGEQNAANVQEQRGDRRFHVSLSRELRPFFLPTGANSVGSGQRCPGASNSWVSSGPQVPAA